MLKIFRVPFDKEITIKDFNPDDTLDYKSADDVREDFKELNLKMIDLQELIYAEKKRSLLIIFQAMDAGGKDGTIKHVMRGINPQGCTVTCFKAPNDEEKSHDYLWRVHQRVPGRGYIGIFNRSHYEEVLITRTHKLIDHDEVKRRFEQINDFEDMLTENGTTVLKFFLNISREEQRQRLQERLDDKEKHWKFDPADINERALWHEYIKAYEDIFTYCNKKHAPWFVIPSNKKWFRNLSVAKIIVQTLENLDMKFPKPTYDIHAIKEIPE
jgi:PPK2 family polyphosphate:nucleotide phosphotransferase